MQYKRLDDDYIQIVPGDTPIKTVLEEVARQSFKTSLVRTPIKTGDTFPSEQDVASHDFSQYLTYEKQYETQTVPDTENPRGRLGTWAWGPRMKKERVQVDEGLIGMRIDYPNGRQCKTWVIKRDEQWLLKIREYAASETLDENGRVVARDPEKLLEDVRSALGG